MMRRRSAPSSGPAANGISILPSGDAIVEVMLDNDNDDDTKKSSTASQIRSRLIRFSRPFAILAVCLGICSKAMMMKIVSERYSSLPILSIFTADDNRESSYMRRSLKIEEATPPDTVTVDDGSAVDNDKDTNTADIDTGVKIDKKGNLGQFVMEHKAKLSSTHSDEKKIAKELKIAQNMIKKAELKAKAAEEEKVSAKEQKKVEEHKKSTEKQHEPNKPLSKVRAHEHKNKPVMKGSVKLKEDQQSQSNKKAAAIKNPNLKDNSKKHPHTKHTNKQKDIVVVKQAVKKQSDMKHQPIVKGKHNGKKEKKPVAGHDNKKVKEQHHVAANPIKKGKQMIIDAHKHSATKQK